MDVLPVWQLLDENDDEDEDQAQQLRKMVFYVTVQ